MIPIRRVLLLATVVFLLSTSLASAASPSTPKFRTSRFYVECSEGAKVQNVPVMMSRAWPTWVVAKPTGSMYDGDGCLQYENSHGDADEDHPFDVVYRGTFKGNVDSVTVKAYVTPPDGAMNVLLWIRLIVDGKIRYFTYPAAPIDLSYQRVDEPTLKRVSFTFVGLDMASEAGYGSKRRSFSIAMDMRQSDLNLWHWGSSEAPASVVFNPKTPERRVLYTH